MTRFEKGVVFLVVCFCRVFSREKRSPAMRQLNECRDRVLKVTRSFETKEMRVEPSDMNSSLSLSLSVMIFLCPFHFGFLDLVHPDA